MSFFWDHFSKVKALRGIRHLTIWARSLSTDRLNVKREIVKGMLDTSGIQDKSRFVYQLIGNEAKSLSGNLLFTQQFFMQSALLKDLALFPINCQAKRRKLNRYVDSGFKPHARRLAFGLPVDRERGQTIEWKSFHRRKVFHVERPTQRLGSVPYQLTGQNANNLIVKWIWDSNRMQQNLCLAFQLIGDQSSVQYRLPHCRIFIVRMLSSAPGQRAKAPNLVNSKILLAY